MNLSKAITVALIMLILTVAQAQKQTMFRETMVEMPTYEFSDPNPVPNVGRIYPYFRFDGYSSKSVSKKWKFIELENDYIKVFITPEIGGKIWGAVEKSTGKEFIYFNHAVKFRDIAMRGPWTSGGIETNFGVIGHAPTCSTPVDYLLKKNEDGSVSCFIGAIDLPSRTVWRMEIRLPPDKSWFTTKALWYNPTQIEQSYYQWMNAAVKANGNLQFSYPGTNYIGHDGSLHAWPKHPNGKDISWYENNNFGGYKSYHVLGELTGFYGGYWHDEDFGFGHYADYNSKPGKKLWIWGLSRQGMIWEDLLTDTDGQYVEVQSGRLFNQEAESSILSPFKHRSFAPLAADKWTEYWFPVMSTDGIVQALPEASLNMEVRKDSLHLWLGANEAIDDSLHIEIKGNMLAAYPIHMTPTSVFYRTLPFYGSKDQVAVRIGKKYIIPPGGLASQKLSRPLKSNDFDWNTVQGMAIKAKSLEQERKFPLALETYLKCLDKDPNYIPALVGAASILYRRTAYDEGLKFATRALSIDTYNPTANFVYGALNEEIGNVADAIDGYAIATASPAYKSAAYYGLASIYFKRGETSKSIKYATSSLEFNAINVPAHELLLMAYEKIKNEKEFQSELKRILQLDPLNHLANFEKYRASQDSRDLLNFKKSITNELAQETYLELAIQYYNLGETKTAEMVLSSSPDHPMVFYWQGYLAHLKGSDSHAKSETYLKKANSLGPDLVFPFRKESIKVLDWASHVSDSWKPGFYKGLILWNLGLIEDARQQFLLLEDQPDYFPFYLAKANLFKNSYEIVTESIKKAHELAPYSWRVNLVLSENYLDHANVKQALKVTEQSFRQQVNNYYLGLQYAKILLLSNRNRDCAGLLEHMQVLPNEGSTEGHHLYRLSNLNLAIEAYQNGDYKNVTEYLIKARSWPENLGVGKPYNTDERIEDYLLALNLKKSGKKTRANELFEKIINFNTGTEAKSITAGNVLFLASLLKLGRGAEVEVIIKQWQANFPKDQYVSWVSQWFTGNSNQLKLKIHDQQSKNLNRQIGSRDYYLVWVFDLLTSMK